MAAENVGQACLVFDCDLTFVLGRRQHPWFNQHLPRYLAVIQADTMATSPLIDTDMVDEVTKLGFDREEVIQSVKHRQQNKVRLVAVLVGSQQQGCNACAGSISSHARCSGFPPLHCACHQLFVFHLCLCYKQGQDSGHGLKRPLAC